ncbi:hypothetical protein ABRY95_00050 [Castellaniella ginsengisoli]|uniref:Uncharacterized protein n=1 Tax=Castellaniella ginsengisoli TaxID=546114 RepID=A0AB39GTI5_9BURK
MTLDELNRLGSGQPAESAQADREKLMRAIVEAGQRAGIIRSDLETVSGTECLHILECLSEPAASAKPVVTTRHDTLVQILREAARILEAIPAGQEPACMRFPIIDELEGFAFAFEHAAIPAAQEPVGEVFTMEPLDGSGDVRSHALLTKPLPAGTQLFAALVAAQPTIKDSLTVQPAQDREDAERYREFFAAGLPITFLGADYRDKPSLDAAIDAARAAKVADNA